MQNSGLIVSYLGREAFLQRMCVETQQYFHRREMTVIGEHLLGRWYSIACPFVKEKWKVSFLSFTTVLWSTTYLVFILMFLLLKGLVFIKLTTLMKFCNAWLTVLIWNAHFSLRISLILHKTHDSGMGSQWGHQVTLYIKCWKA